MGALVKLAEGQNGSVLRREGTILLDSLDGTYIALLPASHIPAMASSEQVVAIEAHESGKLHMDVTHVTTGADKVQAGSTVADNTIPAYTGKGVVVGISDGGFDYTHPMFFDAQGNLRIKKAWDVYAKNSNGYVRMSRSVLLGVSNVNSIKSVDNNNESIGISWEDDADTTGEAI